MKAECSRPGSPATAAAVRISPHWRSQEHRAGSPERSACHRGRARSRHRHVRGEERRTVGHSGPAAPRWSTVVSRSWNASVSGLIVQRLGVGDLRSGELEAPSAQIEVDEEGTRDRQRVHGRADVVGDARSAGPSQGCGHHRRWLIGPRHLHGQPGSSHGHGGCHAIGARSDDDGIYLGVAHGFSLGERGDTLSYIEQSDDPHRGPSFREQSQSTSQVAQTASTMIGIEGDRR